MFAVGDRRLLSSAHWSGLAAAGILTAAALSACGSTGRPGPAGVATAGGRSAPGSVVTQPAPVVSTMRGTPSTTMLTAAASPAGASATGAGGGTTAGAEVPRPAPEPTTDRPVATAVPPMCVPAELQASFDVQPLAGPQPTDRTRALIVITDVSATACTVAGFATVEAVEGDGARPLAASHLDQPGRPGTVVLQSGGAAYAGMEWTSTASCPDVSGFRIVPPGQDATLSVGVVPDGLSGPIDVCAAGIDLGPFAAMSVGTVAFPDASDAG